MRNWSDASPGGGDWPPTLVPTARGGPGRGASPVHQQPDLQGLVLTVLVPEARTGEHVVRSRRRPWLVTKPKTAHPA
jgi:hypothetical protein